MLNITFLGINGSVQDAKSPNTSLLVDNGQSFVLIDTSANLFYPVKKDIDAVIITHEHIDHMYGLPSLLHQMWICKRQKPLLIICPEGIKDKVNYLIDGFALRQKKGIFDISIKPAEDISIGELNFSFFKTMHTANSVGMMITNKENKVIYTCDTAPLEDLPKTMYNPQLLIHETNSLSKDRKPDHSSGIEAGTLANKIGAKKLIICHLPANKSTQKAILQETKTLFKKTSVPKVLRTIVVG